MVGPFTVGRIECRLLKDGDGALPAEILLANVPPAEREQALGDRLEPDGLVPCPYNCLLLHADGRVMLVDTGLGPNSQPFGGAGGKLEDELRKAELTPEDVDVLVLTHSHPDHIGGLCRDSRPRFPRARHLISRLEWQLLAEDSSSGEAGTLAREQIHPLADAGLIDLVDAPVEVADGVVLLPTPGHSPGHLALELDERGLFLADVVVDELHVEHPEWTMGFDADPSVVVDTRRQLLGRAADERLIVIASHLPGPARVERAGEAFRLLPLEPGG